MAVGASKPTVVSDSEGFFSVKNKMLVCLVSSSRVQSVASANFNNENS